MSGEDQDYQSTLRKLSILYQISRYVSSTLDIGKVLRTILNGVTFGNGFGFNRAYLFLADKKREHLSGRMAVGPDSQQDAEAIWNQIREENFTLQDFLEAQSMQERHLSSELNNRVRSINIPLINSEHLLARAFKENRIINADLESEEFKDQPIEQQIISVIGHPRFCILPLSSKTGPLGLMIVDNKYNNRPITGDDINFLQMLGRQAALAIENANAYHELESTVRRLVKINREVRCLKEYNENIIRSIPIGICVVDTGYIVSACNYGFCRMADRTREELAGKPVSNMNLKIRGINIKRYLRKVIHIQKNRSFERAEYSFGRQGGICNLILSPFRAEKGKIDGIVITIDDITEKIKMEESIRELKRLAQLGELTAQVAHEIRNPLAALGGYARRLKKQYIEGREIEIDSLNIIVDEVRRLEDILGSTLQMGGSREAVFERVNILDVIRECKQAVYAYAEDKNTDLSLVVSPETGQMEAEGSQSQLKQALINLIKNSIEASYGGEPIRICVEKEGNTAVIRVENRGSIIEQKDIGKIFLPFYSTKKEGTGLGLAITKRIVLDHKGSIDVYSKKGNTVFTIKLPLAGGGNEKNTDC